MLLHRWYGVNIFLSLWLSNKLQKYSSNGEIYCWRWNLKSRLNLQNQCDHINKPDTFSIYMTNLLTSSSTINRLGVIVISNRNRLQSITFFEVIVIVIDYFCENYKVIVIVIDYKGKVIVIVLHLWLQWNLNEKGKISRND